MDWKTMLAYITGSVGREADVHKKLSVPDAALLNAFRGQLILL